MNKYTSLIVLSALAATTTLAVKAAPSDANSNRQGTGAQETQIGQLDKRLSERIREQQELLGMVERLLGMNYASSEAESGRRSGGLLSGAPKPPAPPVIAPVVSKAVVPAPVLAPWWTEYKLQMVYMSGQERYAVVNGKMLTLGQTVDKDVVLQRVEDDLVVLRQGRESHTYLLKK